MPECQDLCVQTVIKLSGVEVSSIGLKIKHSPICTFRVCLFVGVGKAGSRATPITRTKTHLSQCRPSFSINPRCLIAWPSPLCTPDLYFFTSTYQSNTQRSVDCAIEM